jgi:predicted ArsR family transcriptional regulator
MVRKLSKSEDRKTRRALVYLLKTEGPLTSAQLADRLELTAMAVRQHLYVLQAEKFVTVEERRVPVGRPAKYWQLTAQADRFFPDAYSELTVSLLGALGDAFGAKGLKRVLQTRRAGQLAAYAGRIKPSASLKDKLRQLARLRAEEGYMAEVKPGGQASYLFIENHCPICAVATECQAFCTSELDLFRSLLGSEIGVEREEHIISGARRCTYRVKRVS